MAVLILVGLLAGAATCLSPCVLPVLPVVLSVGAGGGRRAPVAMAVGLAGSFAVFTLLASRLLAALGLPQDTLRWVAVAVIATAGAALVLPRVAALAGRPFEPLAAAVGTRLARHDGTLPGAAVGVALGLVWAPCAGPVLAAVTVLAAQQAVTADVVALTAAYAVGAALPLLGVALVGRRTTAVVPMLRRHAGGLRRLAGATLVASALLLATPVPERLATAAPGFTSGLQRAERSEAARTRLADLRPPPPAAAWQPPPALTVHGDLGRYGRAPAVAGEAWLNAAGGRAPDLRGRVVLVDFWTYSCVNCVRTLDELRRLDARYRHRGLTVVGVHTPEFAFERERRNVERAVRRHRLRYPVAIDNGYAVWTAWGAAWWPSTYLVDRDGEVRYFHVGEGAEEETEAAIQTLLGERATAAPTQRTAAARTDATAEVRLGARRARDYIQPLAVGRMARYTLPRGQLHRVSLGGRWRVEEDRIVAGPGAVVRLAYAARKAFVVLARPPAGVGRATVAIDGRPQRTVTVTEDDLHLLADAGPGRWGSALELRLSPGTAAYTFSFG